MDWHALLQAGLGVLRLRPKDFWALTPVELQLMLGRSLGQMPLGRADLDRLQAAFPDHREGESE